MRARDEADADIAVKLRDRALGYSHSSEKICEVVRVETIEHYPPDTKAAETWLYNRQPTKWKRDRSISKPGANLRWPGRTLRLADGTLFASGAVA